MTLIEQKSIETQNTLQRDIGRLRGQLEYATALKALTLIDDVLPKAKIQQDVPDAQALVTLTKEQWYEIKDFIYALRRSEAWRFSDSARIANDELKIKEGILKQLTT